MTVGVNESDTDFDTAEKTGGEKTHKLTASEMPKHAHSTVAENYSLGLRNTLGSAGTSMGVFYGNSGHATGSSGSDQSHNNMQPYITVYRWRRTA